MNTTIIYGYGVNSDTLYQIKTEKLMDFLQMHLPDDYQLMLDEVTQNIEEPALSDYEDWLSYCSCINSGIEGKYSIISTAISEETGIRFEYQDSSSECAVMLPESMTWQLNEYEAVCTKDSLNTLLKKYFRELDIEAVPTKVSVKYCG